MKKSWEMDLDLMKTIGRSRDRPRTCPARVDRRENMDAGSKTPRTARSGTTPTALGSKGYKVDRTDVYITGSQRTLQIVSGMRSRSHENRLHKLKSK